MTTSGQARVSVVVPCFNDGATLRETVASVLAQEHCELVVVDDGSTDAATLEVIAELEREGIRILRQENQGVPKARMAGVAATSAVYVFPLDADDVLLPGALTALADALDADQDAVAAWGDTCFFGDVEARVRSARRIDPWRLRFVNEHPTTGLFRREPLLEVGGWTFTGGYEDWDLWMAFAERGWQGTYVERPIARYRVHGSRLWREHTRRHDEIFAELTRRRPGLVAGQAGTRRTTSTSAPVRLLLPLIGKLPLPARRRIALANLLARPGSTLRLAVGLRTARARRALAGGHRTRVRPAPPQAVAVVGAGPYGLSVAAHLRHAGIPVHVFGQPFESWERHMPAGMLLRSHWRASFIADPERRLGLDRFHELHGLERVEPVPLDRFVDYGRWFQQEAVPEVDRRRVERITRNGSGFQLELEDGGRVETERVVVAAGIVPFASRPPAFRQLPSSVVSHSVDACDLSAWAASRVAVVGGGQSAVEYAALLTEAGAKVELLVRDASIRWLDHEGVRSSAGAGLYAYRRIGIGGSRSSWLVAAPFVYRRFPRPWRDELAYHCIRPAAAGWLRRRSEGVKITFDRRISSVAAEDNAVRIEFQDGHRLEVDCVLLATGFDVDVSRYAFLDRDLLAGLRTRNGFPVLDGGLESSVPGLHFVGAAAADSFGPIMRFVCGTWAAARATTRRIAGGARPRTGFSW